MSQVAQPTQTKQINPTAVRELNRAKIALMQKPNTAFFSSILMSLRVVWDDPKCPHRAATNGRDLFLNSEWFLSITPAQRVGVLVHESQHVAYDHMGRIGARSQDKWNRAADYCINLQIHKAKLELPDPHLYDEKYEGMTAEKIYSLLPENPQGDYMSDLMPVPSGSLAEHTQHVREVLVRAAQQSKQSNDAPGTIPGDVELYLDNLLNPKLPWYSILRKFFKSFDKSDYSFRLPNRRFMPQHYLPSMHGRKLMDLAIAVDISGSVSDDDFKRIVSEVNGILKMLKPNKITLLQFDTKICSIHIIKSVMDLMKVKFTGRGGTIIEPVLKWADDHRPQALLVMTDGGFYFHGPQTTVPTVWVIHDNKGFQAQFGEVIHYEMEHDKY